MIDALGVKRSWGDPRKPNAAALATLRDAYRAAAGIRGYLINAGIPRGFAGEFGVQPEVKVLSLSDTIVAAATLEHRPGESVREDDYPADVDDRTLGGLVDLVALVSAYVMRMSAAADPPLVYRGTITVGAVLVDTPRVSTVWKGDESVPAGTFLLGPAVAEAARWYEQADGGFVWLSEEAARLPCPTVRPHGQLLFEYRVPLKKCEPLATKVVTPFVDVAKGEHTDRIRAGYARALAAGGDDETKKRDKTFALLDTLLAVK